MDKKIINLITNKDILIFSDTHLSNTFDKQKYQFLQKIIQPAQVVIINGDFWDYFKTSLQDFLNSEWQSLFKLLKSKQTYYLCGNHDKLQMLNDNVLQWCDQYGSEIHLTHNNKQYLIVHGDKFLPTEKAQDFMQKVHANKYIDFMIGCIYVLGNKFLGKYFYLPHKLAVNNKHKNHAKQNKIYLICGHSHFPEVTKHYANSGTISLSQKNYLLLLQDKVELKG